MKAQHQFQTIISTLIRLTEEMRKQTQKQQQGDKIHSKYNIDKAILPQVWHFDLNA